MIVRLFLIYTLASSLSFAQGKDTSEIIKTENQTARNDSLNSQKLLETEQLISKQREQLKNDSIVKAELIKQIELSSSDFKNKTELEEQLRQIQINDSLRNREQNKRIAELRKTSKGFPVNPFGDTLFLIYTRIGSSTPAERAEAITKRIKKLYENDSFDKDSLLIIESESGHDIVYKDEIILSVTEYDAKWYEKPQEQIAGMCLNRIRDSILQEKEIRSLPNLLIRIGYALLIILVLAVLMYMINILFRRFAFFISQSKVKHFSGIRIGDFNLLNPQQHQNFFLLLNRVAKFFIKVVVIYFTLPLLLSIFPSTKIYTDTLLDWVLTPAKNIISGILDFLPNLFTIIVIFIFTHYSIRALKYFADEIEKGNLSIGGFYKDWTKPTFNILKFILYAFMMVLIFPYLPGSDSDAFKGISVFIGILISFGSTSAITNIVAGLVITYMRPFQIGDIIKIGDVMGIVTEKTMLVTRIRTIKNEDVSVPNSSVLSGHTVNYSSHSGNPGLILHTAVTIGYDVPWKKMHEALINAALRTELILKEPKPFVLQTSLDDFYVSYQLNAYTHEAGKQAVIYSSLHENIQDCCNEADIEIMSPHYRNMRDGNMTTIPAHYLPKDYVPPAFNVRNLDDDSRGVRT